MYFLYIKIFFSLFAFVNSSLKVTFQIALVCVSIYIYIYMVLLSQYLHFAIFQNIFILLICLRGSVVVKALGYKPEGRGFKSR
jgi:hypothetical protein